MKKLFLLFVTLFLVLSVNVTRAETEYEDMSRFSLKILLQHCDQSDEIKIVRIRNRDTGVDAFCIEPHVSYKPSLYNYEKKYSDDLILFDLYHAYELLGKSEEAFIAVQLMMWEALYDERFTFDGLGADDYLKKEVESLLEGFVKERNTQNITLSAEVNEEKQISIENLDKYDITSDLQILETTENTLTFMAAAQEGQSHIILTPKLMVPEGSFVYFSKESQNIYTFVGNYDQFNPIDILVETIYNDLTISFSKLDLHNSPISGAEFTLYRLNENGNENLYFLKTGAGVDLFEVLINNLDEYDQNRLAISLSERYERYLKGSTIKTDEKGSFPFKITYNDEIIHQGIVYVTDDIENDFTKYKADEITKLTSNSQTDNQISGLKKDNHYYLCESKPSNGYTYKDDPCKLISTYDDSYLDEHVFYNEKRTYTLKLIKSNPEKTIALNGALFRLNYDENGIERSYLFKTGALNIFNDNDYKYLIYKYENSDNIYIKEFNDRQYIEDNVAYGRYYYYLSNDKDIDTTKLNRYVDVFEGSFMIDDIPYSANLYLTEIEAPKGYFIEEADFELQADIEYSEIIFKNYRVNAFDIIPAIRRKIPKTCIGE